MADEQEEQTYSEFKQEAVENEPYFHETKMDNISIRDLNSLEVDDKRFPLAESGLESLQDLVKLPDRLSQKLSRYINDDAPAEVMEAFRSSISQSDNKDLFVAVDKSEQEIVNVSERYSRVTRKGFFDLAERIINEYGLSVTGTSLDDGVIQIQTEMKDELVNHSLFEDEVFRSGPSFVSDLGLLEIHNFLYRMVCGNGMVMPRGEQDFRASLNREDMTEFFEYIHELSENNFIHPDFFNQLERAKKYDASYYEMEKAAKRLASFYKGPEVELPERLGEFIPYYEVREAYHQSDGENPDDMSARKKHNAPTPMSYWNLINGITRFASHDQSDKNFDFEDSDRDRLISEAGQMVAKKPDAMDIVQDIPDFRFN